jgi:DNA-binding response OmpR family regulator
MRLLLVEDDPVMSTTLARALERRGLRVAAVGDGLAAQAHWQRHPPDAVLLDLS